MLYNWAKETTTTTGTGNLTIASSSGFPRISATVGTNKMFAYAILDDSTGAPLESGIGYLSDANTLVRSKIKETMVSGTYDNTAPTAVSLAAGTKRVICTGLAQHIAPTLPTVGNGAGNKYIGNGCIHVSMAQPDAHVPAEAGKLYLFPWLHNYGGEVDAFVCRVSSAAAAGKILRIGLYDVSQSTGHPSELIVEGSSSIDVSSTGVKTVTFPSRVIPPGWYYFGFLTDQTTGGYTGSQYVVSATIFETTPWGHDGDQVSGCVGYCNSVAMTAMPATCPALNGISQNAKVPYLGIRAV